MLATLLRPAPAFGGADANEVALYIGNAAKYGQRPAAGAGISPPFRECRDREIATGSITADATSVSPGPWPPLPMPIAIDPAYDGPPGSPHGTPRMP